MAKLKVGIGMHYLKRLIYMGVSNGVTLSLVRALTMRAETAVVLMYHELAEDDTDIEAWTVVRKSDFLRQMEYVGRHYEIVSLETALNRTRREGRPGRPMAVVTFDDGDRGNASILLPTIQALNIPVTVYVATGQIVEQTPYWFDRVVNALQLERPATLDLSAFGLGRYAVNDTRGAENWRQIQRLLEGLKSLDTDKRAAAVDKILSDLGGLERRPACRIEPMNVGEIKTLASSSLVTIGAHSHCHSILTQLAPGEVEQSIKRSKDLLEKWTGRAVEHFAYPNGNYDAGTVDIVRQAGFRSAVTTEGRAWHLQDSPYAIPRVGVGRYDRPENFRLNLVGGIRRLLPGRPHPGAALRRAA